MAVRISTATWNRDAFFSVLAFSGNPVYGVVWLDTHKKMKLHVHHGYEHAADDGPKGATDLTPKEKRMVDRVNKLWYNRKRKLW